MRMWHVQALRAFPFPWAEQLTSLQHSPRVQVCSLIEGCGCHSESLWHRACACESAGPSQPWGAFAPAFPQQRTAAHALPDLAFLTGLPQEMVPCWQSKVGHRVWDCSK